MANLASFGSAGFGSMPSDPYFNVIGARTVPADTEITGVLSSTFLFDSFLVICDVEESAGTDTISIYSRNVIQIGQTGPPQLEAVLNGPGQHRTVIPNRGETTVIVDVAGADQRIGVIAIPYTAS
jgi:hypothetical protein